MVAASFDQPILQGELGEESELVVIFLLWVAADYVVRLLLPLVYTETLKSTPILNRKRISVLQAGVTFETRKYFIPFNFSADCRQFIGFLLPFWISIDNLRFLPDFPNILGGCLGDISHLPLNLLPFRMIFLFGIIGIIPDYLFLLLLRVVIVVFLGVAMIEAFVEPSGLAEWVRWYQVGLSSRGLRYQYVKGRGSTSINKILYCGWKSNSHCSNKLYLSMASKSPEKERRQKDPVSQMRIHREGLHKQHLAQKINQNFQMNQPSHIHFHTQKVNNNPYLLMKFQNQGRTINGVDITQKLGERNSSGVLTEQINDKLKTVTHTPKDKWNLPQTSNQQFGWYVDRKTAENPQFVHKREGCPQTHYADSYYTMRHVSLFSNKSRK